MFFLDLALNSLRELLYFPIWWYHRGLRRTTVFCLTKAHQGWQASALPILLRNLFTPMYGQAGWDAFVLTLFSRFWQIAPRMLFVTIWWLIWLVVFLAWLALPPFVIWQLYA